MAGLDPATQRARVVVPTQGMDGRDEL